MLNVVGVEIAKTSHGQGLFASQTFEAGDVIGQIVGAVLDDPEYSSDYCIDLGDDLSLEPTAPFRFLNHSCEPNCELYILETDEEDAAAGELPIVLLETTRRILPGEELTIDYAWPADSAIPCGCEANGCRGWIVSREEASQMKRQKLAARSCA